MQEIIKVETDKREGLYDVTEGVQGIVGNSEVETGIANIYVRGATAGIMIQENWDDSVQQDVVELLRKLIPRGVWEHDKQDGNGDAHLKSGLVSPGETIPVMKGKLALSTWQNVFLCEFDGPRRERAVVVTVISE